MKVNKYILYIILFLIVICSACDNTDKDMLSPEDYMKWVKENDLLVKEQALGAFIYSIRYLPDDYYLAKEFVSGNVLETQKEQDENELPSHISFICKISTIDGSTSPIRYNVTSNEEYSYNLQYCSFNIAEDFVLVVGNDTMSCVNALCMREYSVKPYNTIILSFENITGKHFDLKKDMTVVYEDYLWGNGIIKFKIDKENLNQIPLLNY